MVRYITLAVLDPVHGQLAAQDGVALDDQPEIRGGDSRVLFQHLIESVDLTGRMIHAGIRGNVPTPTDLAPGLRDLVDRDAAFHGLDGDGRPSAPLEAGSARVSVGRARKARGGREAKARRAEGEVPDADRRDRRQDPGGRGRCRDARPRVCARSTTSSRLLEGQHGKDRHPAAVPEGRSRQQAQLLRRHDRPRRGTPGPGVPGDRRRPTPSASSDRCRWSSKPPRRR